MLIIFFGFAKKLVAFIDMDNCKICNVYQKHLIGYHKTVDYHIVAM